MAGIQLQVLSDLHLETPAAYDIYDISPSAPYLALLGDIGYVRDEGFFLFLRKQLANFRIVFLVLGNHEAYHSTWSQTKSHVQRFKDDADRSFRNGELIGELVILDQVRYDISPTVTILGCTLFSHVGDDQIDTVNLGLNDFYHIDDWPIEAQQEAHRADLAWLNHEVGAIARLEPHRKVIVLTHYCPSTQKEVIDPRHVSSKISSGFMTDLSSEVCWKNEVVKLWAFGHTHFNCDVQDSTTGKRVFTNQRGYYFAQSSGFDAGKVIQV
ncbi:uncharacterized protein BO97DRAFT_407426 [Aspergillus homomorphus CBS 101889]|uniref:Calcineurin-like phosphoesterase domain-containing protein n=1 Tax=Aspergillus homomorphus (strain CBS 101889) TaxID=1450537 RepID=A0A395HQ59_ASPHC|nr:hypothetical protein BO97DRAFT_407426 [Aspergillus homomorphus CBS 101889]RAL09880.1 hypothetical protein BO97DRAFT_407426 [Aspergillus homomorphus CBS 101889]